MEARIALEEEYDQEEDNSQQEDLTPDDIRRFYEPKPSDEKIILRYSAETKRYLFDKPEEDKAAEYGIESGEIWKVLSKLQHTKRNRPFENSAPIHVKGLHWLVHILVMLLYSYFSFLVLQVTLFNLILLGLAIAMGRKLSKGLSKFFYKQSYKYQYGGFNRILKEANEGYFETKSAQITGGHEGRWLEIQLPEIFTDIPERKGTGTFTVKENDNESQATGFF